MDWYEDPVFDNEEEVYCGKTFKGEDWRRLQFWKEQGMADLLSVAGTTFKREGIEKVVNMSHKTVQLVKEPDNRYDKNAIKVEVSGQHVGYVPKGKQLSPDARVNVCKVGLEPNPYVWLAVTSC